MSEVLYAPSATLADTHHPTAPKRSGGWPRLPALHTETVFVLTGVYEQDLDFSAHSRQG